MSLRAVQTVLLNKLQGWTTNGMENAGLLPLDCYIAPPQVVINTLEGPAVFIWGGRADIKRHTPPSTPTHTGGFKRAPWGCDIWVMFIDKPAPDDTVMPIILDAIRMAIETIPYPQAIFDEDSSPQYTQLIEAGEDILIEQAPPHEIEDQSNLLYTAHLTVSMIEDYQS
jgi:hypothetical protein